MDHTAPLTEETVQRYTDYINAGAYALRSRNGFRIPALVIEQWRERGFAILYTATLARTYGVGRRTMWNTIAGVIDAGFIKEIGRTPEGKAMFVPVLERGDEWRAARDERLSAYVE
ncbi:hypothetical protein [Neorhizobium sp. JUb45]|uniref:hypothetical protein n=1 Tax=Neorhizobium sp. JUb45 TaxID=2485113 RepID=UPI00104DA62C|nr:hypothetical protein [Neorhizobium sp. JUb45]TCR04059.1 hypothetical protein EDF70_102155 [Neorhizobium sp. JUb45]